MKPSDFAKEWPWGSVKQNSECEQIAKNIMTILSITGDEWRELTLDEYTAIRKTHNGWTSAENGLFEKVIAYCKSEDTARLFSPAWKEIE